MSSPTKRTYEKWQSENAGQDFLQLLSANGAVEAGIDSTGTPYGNLAIGSGGAGTVQTDSSLSGNGSASSPLSVVSVPASGIPSGVVQSGLMAEYRILSTESAAALVDYSGNGNGATGTAGTAPTLFATSGGLNLSGVGAVMLPAALNSAKTIQIFATYLRTSNTNNTNSLVQGSGANSIAFAAYGATSVPAVGSSNSVLTGSARMLSFINGPSYKSFSTGIIAGTNFYSMLLDTNDRFFIGSQESLYYQSGSSVGLQTNGSYQLGGISGTYMTGAIYYALFYNRVLTAAEVAKNNDTVVALMAARGVQVVIGDTVSQRDQIAAHGDSITAGQGVTAYTLLMGVGNGETTDISNQGLPGTSTTQMLADAPLSVDPLYRPKASRNVVVIWGGTNVDVGGPVRTWANLAAYCRARRAIGWKIVLVTMISRFGEDATKNALNILIRQGWQTCADALADVAANPQLGADGAYANVTYFQDGIHPTQAGVNIGEVPIIQAAINSLYGNTIQSAYPNTIVQPSAGGFLQAVGSANPNTDANNQFTYTLPNPVSQGNLLVMINRINPNTVTDNQNNVWTQIGTTHVWYALNVNPGITTVTLQYGSPQTMNGAMFEYSNVQNAAPEASSTNTGTGTSWTAGSLTSLTNNDLILGLGYNDTENNPVLTAGATFTLNLDGKTPAGTNAFGESKILASAGAVNPGVTSTNSDTWHMVGAAFKTNAAPAYQLAPTDLFVMADPTSANVLATLQDATQMMGQIVEIKNIGSGANTVTIQCLNSQTIDGGSTTTISNGSAKKFKAVLVSPSAAGANWVTI